LRIIYTALRQIQVIERSRNAQNLATSSIDPHYIHRSNWLRAAVLGANDGIISISSLAIGVAAASVTREPIVLATVAGLVAGALSMAAGEYVSVSSQTDTETGGSSIPKAIARITIWGTIAMGLSALVGSLFGVNV
jgi:VIT1/CCC1 family predicted Fe2+/Mn2+ transporter